MADTPPTTSPTDATTTDGASQGPSRADCCAITHDLAETAVATDVETLAALGNETRYETLRLVADAGRPVCVCEIEPSLAVSQGAVSQALSRLHTAGLVTREKRSRWRYYEATPRAIRLLGTLDETRPGTADGVRTEA